MADLRLPLRSDTHHAAALPCSGINDIDEMERNQLALGGMRWIHDDDFNSTVIAAIDATFDAVGARNAKIEAAAVANLKTLTEAVDLEATTRAADVAATNGALVANATELKAAIATERTVSNNADAHISAVLANLTLAVADNHAAAATNLDIAVTALDLSVIPRSRAC